MKLNYKRTIFIGMAFLSICSFWQVYDSLIPLMLKNTFGLGDGVSGIIMSLDNVLALFLLPIMGSLSDRVHTPLGKRMPFILSGTVLAIICMIFLPIADRAVSFVMFFIALGATLLSMASYRSPAVALMADVTPKPLRSKGNAVINLMGALGAVVSLALIALLVPKEGKPDYFPIFLIVAALMIFSVAILFITTKENRLVKEMEESGGYESTEEELNEALTKGVKMPKEILKSLICMLLCIAFFFIGYNAVTTSFSKYMQEYMHIAGGGFANVLMIATVSSVIAYIPVGFLATKIGRKRTILLGLGLMGLCFGVAALFTAPSPFLYVIFVLVGIGYAAIIVNTFPMIWEMARGSDVGKYTGYYYTFSMSAQIITPIVSGYLLEYVGYWTLFPYAVIALAASAGMLLLVRHGDNKPAPKPILESMGGGDEP